MMTGDQYRESLRDGRKVWIMGEGPIDDITVHPATCGVVDEYCAWYDRHLDHAWQEVLLTPDTRLPVGLQIPESSADLIRLGDSIYEQAFVGAGHVTHTPCYGALIALGVLDAVKTMGKAGGGLLAAAEAFQDDVERSGTFVTLTGGASILGDRFRDESEQVGLRIVKETDAGLVVSGRTGMHTSTPFAHEVYIGLQRPDASQRAMFAVRVNSPGVRIVARSTSPRHRDPSTAPLTRRFDELDAQLWLDNVLIPWEKVFARGFEGPSPEENRTRDRIFSWLTWHHQYSYLAHAEFTLGLALAITDSMGLRESPKIIGQLVDLVAAISTIRSCLSAANYEAERSPAGYLCPKPIHVATATIHTLQTRQKMTEILRDIPGSSLVIRPTMADFEDPEMAIELERGFGGGSHTAKQRAALLNLVWDQVSSGLDGRQSAFEMHASGGLQVWRIRVQRWFDRYNLLANKVLKALDVEMPAVDMESLRDVSPFPYRPPASAVQKQPQSQDGAAAPAQPATTS